MFCSFLFTIFSQIVNPFSRKKKFYFFLKTPGEGRIWWALRIRNIKVLTYQAQLLFEISILVCALARVWFHNRLHPVGLMVIIILMEWPLWTHCSPLFNLQRLKRTILNADLRYCQGALDDCFTLREQRRSSSSWMILSPSFWKETRQDILQKWSCEVWS